MSLQIDIDFFKSAAGLKKLRKKKNLSLRQVESLTGVSNSYLSQIESGQMDINNVAIGKIISLIKCYTS